MPAKYLVRVDEEGIYSHVYNKGIEHKVIFNDNEDYQTFLSYLKEYLAPPRDPESIKKVFEVKGRTFRGTPHLPKNYFNKVELFAYSLMPDHFHLLINQVVRGSLENFIRSLCTRYSIYFNKKYLRTGALFDGPYKSMQISDRSALPLLTRFFHNPHNYSSYLEYLGLKETSWIKPKVVLSFFDKGKSAYKDFVEKHKLNQKEKKLLNSINFDNEAPHLEKKKDEKKEVKPNYAPEPRLRMPIFIMVSTAMFVLLFTLGARNVSISIANNSQSLPAHEVLSETEEALPTQVPEPTQAPSPTPTEEPEPSEEIKSGMLKVRIDNATSSASIYERPATDSGKVDEARNNDAFKYVYFDSGWYEIRLVDGSTGFISEELIVKEETEK